MRIGVLLTLLFANACSSNGPRNKASDKALSKSSPEPQLSSIQEEVPDALWPSMDTHVEMIQAVNAHITINKKWEHEGFAPLTEAIQKHPDVVGSQLFAFLEMESKGHKLNLKAVQPKAWLNTMDVTKHLIAGSSELAWDSTAIVDYSVLARESIPPAIIGVGLAKALDLKVGSHFETRLARDIVGLFNDAQADFKTTLRVSGIFEMGYKEYDDLLVVTHAKAVDAEFLIFAELRLKDMDGASTVAEFVRHELGEGYSVMDWCELNSALFYRRCAPKRIVPGSRASATAGCEGGIAQNCTQIGRMWAQGQDGPKDRDRAKDYLQKACERGNAEGCMEMGFIWGDGLGVKVGAKNAIKYNERACELGNTKGCSNLGRILLAETEFADEERAQRLLIKACDDQNRESCYVLGIRATLAKDPKSARRYYEKSCELDYDVGCDRLSQLLSTDLSDPTSLERSIEVEKKATRLYKQACQEGHPYACQRIRTGSF